MKRPPVLLEPAAFFCGEGEGKVRGYKGEVYKVVINRKHHLMNLTLPLHITDQTRLGLRNFRYQNGGQQL